MIDLKQIAVATGGVFVGAGVDTKTRSLEKEDLALLRTAALDSYMEYDTAEVSCIGVTKKHGYVVFNVSLVSRFDLGKFYVKPDTKSLKTFVRRVSDLGESFANMSSFVVGMLPRK